MTLFLSPSLNGISQSFIFVAAQFRTYKITNQQVRFTCLLNGLTPEVEELMYDVLKKQSTKTYDDLKFTILKWIEEQELEYSKRFLTQLHNELLNAEPEG